MKKWVQFIALLFVTAFLAVDVIVLTRFLVEKWIGIRMMETDDFAEKGVDSLTLSADGFYEIKSAEDYRIFWGSVDCTNDDINGRLMCDIRLNDTSNWRKWGEEIPENLTKPVSFYKGIFDGNGHSIYGIYSEKGYGIVRTNEGIIRNLTIRESMISGRLYSGGICYYNGETALISNCRFYGKIDDRFYEKTDGMDMPGDTFSRLAGICVANGGTVKRCGFMGEMRAYSDDRTNECARAGICVQNFKKVEDCYNFSFMKFQGKNDTGFAIADRGERNCYVIKNSGWKMSQEGQDIEITVEQSLSLEKYFARDINALWKDKRPLWKTTSLAEMENSVLRTEAFKDEMVKDIVFEILCRKKGDINNMDFEVVKTKGADFGLLLDYKGESLLISRYVDADTEDVEALWLEESRILSEKNADTWEHSTYALLSAEAPSEDAEFIVNYRTKEEEGIFYTEAGSLYRIVPTRQAADKEDSFLQIAEAEICFNKTKGTGINWQDDTVKRAVYAGLEKEESVLLSREEIRDLKQVEIEGGVKTLMDLENCPNLTRLIIYGEGELTDRAAVKDLGKLKLDQLTELVLYNCRINDISFLNKYKELTSLSLGCNEVTDISALKELTKLEMLALYENQVESIEPLSNMEELTVLNLSDNLVTDLSPLRGKTKLTMLGLSYNRITDISPLLGMTNMVNLSIGSNNVKDISALNGMNKMQWLGLEGNRIEDMTAIREMKQLFYLDVMGNPSQDIGELFLTPFLLIGNAGTGEYEEELVRAQALLNRFPSQQGITAEDMTRGDLNGDGILDLAITGYGGERLNEKGYVEEWGTRRVYVFLGTDTGDYIPFADVETLGPDMGGVYGDPYRGVSISGKYLVVQNYGGSYFRWNDTTIYEYNEGSLRKIYLSSLNYWLGNSGGYEFRIYDYRNGTQKAYAVEGEWDQPVKMLLICDEGDKTSDSYIQKKAEYDAAEKGLRQRAERDGVDLPEIEFWYYGSDIDGDGYYYYHVHDSLAPVLSDPDELLDLAAKKYFSLYAGDMTYFPIPEYSSEEIKNNYDILAGVKLPEGFYIGKDAFGQWRCLSYDSCFQDENGYYVHRFSFERSVMDESSAYWYGDQRLYYYERTGTFELKE